MSSNLYIRNTPEVTARLGNYVNLSFDDLVDDLEVDTVCPEGYRQVMLHVFPLRLIDGEPTLTVFQTGGSAQVYVSKPLTDDDFLCRPGETHLHLAASLLGLITQVTLNLDAKAFPMSLPDVIDGEFVWMFQVAADDHQVSDDFLRSLAPVVGHASLKAMSMDNDSLDSFSKRLIELAGRGHLRLSADDMGEGK